MNERIQELAKQAREHATTRHPVSNIILSVNSDLFEQKFAKLIVRECVKAADEWYQYHNEIQWDPGEHIKQHFGVEE